MNAAVRAQLLAAGAKLPTGKPQERRTPRPAPTEPQTRPASLTGAITQEVFFDGRVPGNNGPGGLLRLHWRKRQKLADAYLLRVKCAGLRPMAGPVRLELVRYSIGRPMDYDNLVSTGKLPIDALVRAGKLPDDNPTVIAERSYTQERAASKDQQRTVIRLIAL